MGQLKIRKPQAILFDISGTATKSYFIDAIVFPYIRMNCQTYLENTWDTGITRKDVQRLREQSHKDAANASNVPVVLGPENDMESIQKSVTSYVLWGLDNPKKMNEATLIFRLHMLFDGYDQDRIETPVYSDVAIQIRHWAVDLKIKLYVFSNGWTEATKRFMSKTNHGNLNLLIDGHFDDSFGSLCDASTYRKVLDQIGQIPSDVLFLTKSAKEARVAKKAGLGVLLVMTHRRDLLKLSDEERATLPFIRNFNELVFTADAPLASSLKGNSTSNQEQQQQPTKPPSSTAPSMQSIKPHSSSGPSRQQSKPSATALTIKSPKSSSSSTATSSTTQLSRSSTNTASSSNNSNTNATIENISRAFSRKTNVDNKNNNSTTHSTTNTTSSSSKKTSSNGANNGSSSNSNSQTSSQTSSSSHKSTKASSSSPNPSPTSSSSSSSSSTTTPTSNSKNRTSSKGIFSDAFKMFKGGQETKNSNTKTSSTGGGGGTKSSNGNNNNDAETKSGGGETSSSSSSNSNSSSGGGGNKTKKSRKWSIK